MNEKWHQNRQFSIKSTLKLVKSFCNHVLMEFAVIKNWEIANLNEKDITEDKKVWQTIKRFLSEKTKSREKITLIVNENLVLDDAEEANCLNIFFLILLKILKYLSMNSHPTFKTVFKNKIHPSIISIRRFHHQVSNFNFPCIGKNTALK